MKKQYMKPAMLVVDVRTPQLLTSSPDSFKINNTQQLDNYDELE